MAKKSKKLVIISEIVFLVVVAAVLGVTMFFCEPIEFALGLKYYEEIPASEAPEGTASASVAGGELNVHFVDVGQGDCAIIELPDGKTMIIDGGEKKNSVVTKITTYIDDNFGADFKYFDYAILTHADSDHCGSLDDVLNTYPARVSYRPNVEASGIDDPGKSQLTSDAVKKNTAVYSDAISAMYRTTADFEPTVYVTDAADDSQTITGGEGDTAYSFRFFTPLSDKYTGEGQWNNYSPIMVLEYQGFNFVMSGDAEEKNLGEFVARVNSAKTDGVTDKYDIFDDNFCADVIKAGHHGSRNATTDDYLSVMLKNKSSVASTYCVISCDGISYGHPHAEALERYATAGVLDENVLRTDKVGDIVFTVRVNESGAYTLYYGDKATEGGRTPVETVKVLVYKTVGDIKLTWPIVAWSAYAVLVVITAVQMFLTASGMKSSGTSSGKSNSKSSGKSSGGRK